MRSTIQTMILLVALSAALSPLHAAADQNAESRQPVVLAPFYTKQEYLPPDPGTYELPALGRAADGAVLDSSGQEGRLSDYLGDGKVVLLSFIYTNCSDINGCPLSTAVLYSIQQKIKDDPWVREHFRMISLSFDPTYDTPEVMKLYGASFRSGGDWRFLTTEGWSQLEPLLEGYHQSVIRDRDAEGGELPSFSHILRVFLIDPQKRIRNIYSVSFLYPELIINDIKTVLMGETNGKTASVDEAEPDLMKVSTKLSHPGDYKEGYESDTYETRSQALDTRKGESADLLSFVEEPPLGLPGVPQPRDNPLTRAKVELGRKLFFDRRLSLNDTISCAMCHVPEQGFANNELATAVGLEGRSVRRNSPTIYNVAYMDRLFHDGREETLEQQIWAPLLAHNEMANPAVGSLMKKIRGLPDYRGLFEQAFDGRGVSMETLGMALASYQRTLISGDSPFDRWHYGGDPTAVSATAKRGFELFTGKAGCSSCHTVGKESALFTDNGLHNTGAGYRESMGIKPEKEEVLLAPGVTVEVERDIIDAVSLPPLPDVGLYEVTQNPSDRWKYRTPGLRNVSLTAPYMHNGSLGTLREVVEFYNSGGVPNKLQDPRIRPLGLSDGEVDELVAFLESLTGSNVDVIVADAFAAPIGDITKEDPHWAHDQLSGE